MMNAYGSYTLLEAIGRKKNLKILLAHLVILQYRRRTRHCCDPSVDKFDASSKSFLPESTRTMSGEVLASQ